MTDGPVFDIRDLSFAYGPLTVLDGLNLTIEPGRFIGVIGPNGCGKTTLVDLMNRGKLPDQGRIEFMGRSLGHYRRAQMARLLALVPQEFAVNFPFTVFETVLMGRHPHIPRFASPRKTDLEAVDRAIDDMDLGRFKDIGERGFTLERLLNIRFGVTAADDTLPKRLTDEPQIPGDPRTKVPLDAMKRDYYRIRGWGADGVPQERKKRKLGLAG